MTITKVPLSNSHALTCPSCGKPIYVAHPADTEVPGGGTWLRDGDTIGGLWDMLSDVQKVPETFDYELMVGGCRSCGNDYYVALASFMEGDKEETHDYLLFNADPGAVRNYICSRDDMRWLLSEYETPIGVMHHHTFGPWALKSPDGVIGRYGVSSCGDGAVAEPWEHARGLLFAAWDDLRALRASAI